MNIFMLNSIIPLCFLILFLTTTHAQINPKPESPPTPNSNPKLTLPDPNATSSHPKIASPDSNATSSHPKLALPDSSATSSHPKPASPKPAPSDSRTPSSHPKLALLDSSASTSHPKPASPKPAPSDASAPSSHPKLASPDSNATSSHPKPASPDSNATSSHPKPAFPKLAPSDASAPSSHPKPTSPGSNATSSHPKPAPPDSSATPSHPKPITTPPPKSNSTTPKPPHAKPTNSPPKPKPKHAKPPPTPKLRTNKTNATSSSPYQFANRFCLSRRLDVKTTFCLQVLRSSPDSTKAKDNYALLTIAADAAIQFTNKNIGLLKKLSKDKTAKPDLKPVVEECVSAYEGYLKQLKILLEEARVEAQLASYDSELAKLEIIRCVKVLGKTRNNEIEAANKAALDYASLSQNIADSIE